jgi:hypothetical protein
MYKRHFSPVQVTQGTVPGPKSCSRLAAAASSSVPTLIVSNAAWVSLFQAIVGTSLSCRARSKTGQDAEDRLLPQL